MQTDVESLTSGPTCPINVRPSTTVRKIRPLSPLILPTMTNFKDFELEFSLHACTSRFLRELRNVFPGVDLTNLKAVPTFQKCVHDLVAWGEDVDLEKDEKLKRVRIL